MDGDISEKSKDSKLPIFYSDYYDITFLGLEKIHAFDSCKWKRIVNFLIEKSQGLRKRITQDCIQEPLEATEMELLIWHEKSYLETLKKSRNVANILEVFFVRFIPNFLLQNYLLRAFRYQVKGTMMAAEAALEKKWAINIGGGYHHASKGRGGGFCVYADISIAIKAIQHKYPTHKFLIIDLDAHQGNGHELDFQEDENVFIMDIYNQGIYPNDNQAKKGINVDVPLISWTRDNEYMDKLKENLNKCFELVAPQLIVYNAGTDCLLGDPLGRLDITEKGIKERDELVFQKAKEMKVPIVMVTSGGYQTSNAEIIADSILNLFEKEIIE